jgi:integrase
METVEPIRSTEKIRQMEDFLRRQSERNWLLFVAGCNSGLRISDLRLLRCKDVQGDFLVIRMKKTGGRVQIPITPRLQRAFQTYTAGKDPNDCLFASRKGWNQPLSRTGCYQIINKAAKACKLERIGNHSMRKTFGWHYYQQTKDIATLRELFGHKDTDVTMRYIGLVQDDINTAMRGFSI